jgi:hypothetical protein
MSDELLRNVRRMRFRGSDFRSSGVPVMLLCRQQRDHALVCSLLDLLRPFVLHLFIWLEQLYDTPVGEDDPFSFCFYYTPQFHRKNATTRQKSQSLWTILGLDVFLIILSPTHSVHTH